MHRLSPETLPLSVLTSALSVERHGQDIAQAVRRATGAARALRWVTPETADSLRGADGTLDCEVAYHTRDITGGSTKGQVLPDLQRYYDLLDASPRLQWLHVHSAGADRPIFPILRARGVRVTTSSGINVAPVAHSAVAAMLMLARRFPELARAQQAQRWAPLLGREDVRDITGQVALVVGQGPIGVAIARMLHALGLRVWAASRSERPAQAPVERSVTYLEIANVVDQVHHLVLACPLSDLTRGLVDARVLAALPAGACIVNVARGEVIDQPALVSALQAGRLGGAYLDVFDSEPLAPGHPLWTLPNVIVSPHTAGHFHELAQGVHRLFMDNLTRYLNGRPLINEIP